MKWIKQNDPDIEIITLHYLKNNFSDIRQCHGIVFSGGVDIHPSFYHGKENYPNAPAKFNKRRDEFELNIFEKTYSHLPILGICRGLQLINVAMNGTLISDMGRLNETHTAIDSSVADKQHEVSVAKNTLLYQITRCSQATVTSAHHQCIDKMGDHLQVNAFSSTDQIIEGIEWQDKTSKPFMIAVQWHPERMFRIGQANNPLSKNLRNTFIETVRLHALK